MEYIWHHESQISEGLEHLTLSLDDVNYELVQAADDDMHGVDVQDEKKFPGFSPLVLVAQMQDHCSRKKFSEGEEELMPKLAVELLVVVVEEVPPAVVVWVHRGCKQ